MKLTKVDKTAKSPNAGTRLVAPAREAAGDGASNAGTSNSGTSNFGETNRFRILIALNAASLLTAVILLVALVFSWTTVSKLRQINAELGELKKLEERIVGKINLMNTGFQNRLERTDDRIEGLQSELMAVNGTLQETGAYIEDQIRDIKRNTRAGEAGIGAGSGDGASADTASGAPQGSPMFRRVVTEDGKIRFEKKR
ncbi:hypothetical protein [Roseibium salinum]|uniref:Uncharacterized protein n=1 Tax=Roseibium salinum TaxID=1604349 RepID=A0ABT3R8Q7_9HYPH|nr:hypothetical protein [Roseibium sp. DSM 29163]MCX2725643.1 hypothetical protein [Roseibium sp. DSM 29163]